jgi:hypothetical protein
MRQDTNRKSSLTQAIHNCIVSQTRRGIRLANRAMTEIGGRPKLRQGLALVLVIGLVVNMVFLGPLGSLSPTSPLPTSEPAADSYNTDPAPDDAVAIEDVPNVPGDGSSEEPADSPTTTTVPNSPPTISSVSPSQGTQGQTLEVTITGTCLEEATAVTISGITVNGLTVDNDTQITANISVGTAAVPGLEDVTVTTSGGTSALSSSFAVQAPVTPTINHRCTDVNAIPQEWIAKVKSDLHIAYGHTSHGSQITTGMTGLVSFMNGKGYPRNLYAWNSGGTGGALDLRDNPFSKAADLGNPDFTAWATATRTYLNAHFDVNVVVWSWCGQLSWATPANVTTYLNLMSGLEEDYPKVKFVYMTGHTDGTGLSGNLHVRNQQIRDYCEANNKILYDFEDIESYDPDGKYFGDKKVADSCAYTGGNWATEWQNSHTQGVDWYECSSAHSEPLNANLKAYSAWWLWARLAGWDGNTL